MEEKHRGNDFQSSPELNLAVAPPHCPQRLLIGPVLLCSPEDDLDKLCKMDRQEFRSQISVLLSNYYINLV